MGVWKDGNYHCLHPAPYISDGKPAVTLTQFGRFQPGRCGTTGDYDLRWNLIVHVGNVDLTEPMRMSVVLSVYWLCKCWMVSGNQTDNHHTHQVTRLTL